VFRGADVILRVNPDRPRGQATTSM